MKYLLNTATNEVRLNGEETAQNELSNFAHNLLNIPSVDTYAGKVLEFESYRQFKKLLLWRNIMNRHDVRNKTFNFMELARQAVAEIKVVLKKDVIEASFS